MCDNLREMQHDTLHKREKEKENKRVKEKKDFQERQPGGTHEQKTLATCDMMLLLVNASPR